MSKSDIKIKWLKDQNGWTGMLLPYFAIFKEKKKLYLQIVEPDAKPECAHRFILIDSVHQGKMMATKIIKERIGK